MNRPVENFVSRLLPIPAEDLQWALAEAQRVERKACDLLEEKLQDGPEGFITRLSATVRLPAMTLDELRSATAAFDLVPFPEASRRACVALRAATDESEGELWVALGDPFDLDLQAWLEERLTVPFRYAVAHRQDIAVFLSQHESQLRALDGAAAGVGEGERSRDTTEEISFETISETDSPVVRVVNSTLYDALKAGASDIHLEATANGLCIKYRIDGVLTPIESIAGTDFAEQAVSRIKVMSDLDIAERRIPQDGRFKARRDGRDIDFRVSIMPSGFGEDAVLRILDKKALTDEMNGLSLSQLGYEGDLIKRIRRASDAPYGMLLVTGPTGSGKTTTLYAAITEVNKGRDKIITIEDPVEYQLPGVLQIPVNEQKGLTFARGLRSILRHDPDRIMVGEIRDSETAEIAVQSALTGHLVYTTVHANNVFDVLGRFMHMGVDTYNFVSALNAVLAQRLVRLVCRHCATPQVPDEALLAESRIDASVAGEYRFMQGRGCAQCRGTGYRGRKAIGELLLMNDVLREMIVAREPVRKLKEAACAAGTVPLRQAALELVKTGQSTLEEINRVTFVA